MTPCAGVRRAAARQGLDKPLRLCKRMRVQVEQLRERGSQATCVSGCVGAVQKRQGTSLNSFPWSAMADGLGVARIDGHADNETRERDGEDRSFTVGVLLESIGVGDERKRRGKVLPVKQGRKRTTGR